MDRDERLRAIVDAAIEGDASQMSDLVSQELLARVADEVDLLRPSIAANLFGVPQEEVEETPDETTESSD